MNKVISVAAAATLSVGLMALSPGAQAKPALPNVDALAAAAPKAEYSQYRARRYGAYRARRGYGQAAGAAAAVGIAGALIGGAIAAQQPRQYYYDQPYGYQQHTYYEQPYQTYGYYGQGGGYDYYD